jgi:hypothetical protein
LGDLSEDGLAAQSRITGGAALARQVPRSFLLAGRPLVPPIGVSVATEKERTMKSYAHRSVARLAGTLSAAAIAVSGLAGVAAAAPATGAFPAAGNGFSISLATSSSYPYASQTVTLTATTNADVGPTPYYITIYSETTGAELGICGSGTTCSASVSQGTPGLQDFEAFVGDNVPGGGHPGFALVSSNVVPVTWWGFVIFPGANRLR